MDQNQSEEATCNQDVKQTVSYGAVENASRTAFRDEFDDKQNETDHATRRESEKSQRFVDQVDAKGGGDVTTIDLDDLQAESENILTCEDSDIPNLCYYIHYHPGLRAYIVYQTFTEDEFAHSELLCSDTKMLFSPHNTYYIHRTLQGEPYPTVQEYVDRFHEQRRQKKMTSIFADIVTVHHLRRLGQLPSSQPLTEAEVQRIYPWNRYPAIP